MLDAGVSKRAIDVLTPDRCASYGGFAKVMPVALVHDVPNCGYRIWIGAESLFYATDTGTLDGITAKGYDLYMVEANHTKEELEARRAEKIAAGEFSYEVNAARNHLSREQAVDWIYKNTGPNSKYVFLHQHVDRQTHRLEEANE